LLVLSLFLWTGRPHQQNAEQLAPVVTSLAKMAKEIVPPEQPPGEWLSLFNGKDREGWEVIGDGKWDVVDGVLKADGKGVGWLASRRSFADFELELQYRLPLRGNSGVFLRARKDAPVDGRDFLEIQLLDDSHYLDMPLNMRNGAVHKEAAPKDTAAVAAERWHRLRIVAEGRTIQVWVNAFRVVFHQTRRPEKAGLLGLQMFRTEVEFRNIRARELAPHP
jgi:hypothetical protein